MGKLITLKTNELVKDEKFYPRIKESWHTCQAYVAAMNTGSVFPPVVVTRWKDKWIIVDGFHRTSAYIQRGDKLVQCEEIVCKDEQEIYKEAVLRNAKHGRPFSYQEKILIAKRLEDLKCEKAEISNITGIKDLGICETRIINTSSGRSIVLKKPVFESDNVGDLTAEEIETAQNKVVGSSQNQILHEVYDMLRSNLINIQENQTVLKKIWKQLDVYFGGGNTDDKSEKHVQSKRKVAKESERSIETLKWEA